MDKELKDPKETDIIENSESYKILQKNINRKNILKVFTILLWSAFIVLSFIVASLPESQMLIYIGGIIFLAAISVTIAFIFIRAKALSQQLHLQLKKSGFILEKEFEIYKYRFLVDKENKKFAVVERNRIVRIYDFSKVISYEIQEDGASVVKGSVGRSLIGGLFFGITGAVIGSSGKRKISNFCTDLRLLIRLNDLEEPLLNMQVINFQVDKQSAVYKNAKQMLYEICAYLEYMINDKTLEQSAKETNVSEENKTTKEKLNELKELLNENYITEEEYNEKKKKILNLWGFVIASEKAGSFGFF